MAPSIAVTPASGKVLFGSRLQTLTGLIEIYKADPDLLKRPSDPK